MYDVIIIGAGPAGIGAAIYCGRAKLSTLVIGDSHKSMLSKAHSVGNFFGFPKDVPGDQLINLGIEQAKKFGCEFIVSEAINAKKQENVFYVVCDNREQYQSKTLIIATGRAFKLANIKHEKDLTGKGVHYCVVCDGYFYEGKKVCVIGYGNNAAEESLELLTYTKDITIISNGHEFEFSPELKKLIEQKNIKLQKDRVVEFYGVEKLEGLILSNGNKLPYDAAFIGLGTTSALNFATKLGLETKENIVVADRDGKTNLEGVYACGDCTGGNAQAAKSIGEGCNAAICVIKHLSGSNIYIDYD